MAYNEKLDKVLFETEIEGPSDTLKISVYSYNGGESKLQIGPRVYEKKNGDKGFRKAGRLNIVETAKLAEVIGNLNSYMG